jgi:hypothetical protein
MFIAKMFIAKTPRNDSSIPSTPNTHKTLKDLTLKNLDAVHN